MERRLGLALAVAVLLLDRLSKWALIDELADLGIVKVTPFFNLVMVWNRGISFGFLQSGHDWAPYLLAALALAVALVLAVWLWRSRRRLTAAALGLVIGGALGNVVDRLLWQAVADFFDFHLMGYHWPAFNIADAAIVAGVAGLLMDGLFERREADKQGT
ncbi:MAG: signal peptidase II [Rhodospirillaceae bacterium]|jgi:signal peptidase II|nr:signal peptidase II [Rhodospirillaceae bacterium]